ncbi:hypothetical protein PO002_33530 [Cupriavidus necator]|uniref:hypothetical protein n=1 Tax=Cupriavidus necator TaxID=106590 RepID=UPI0039C030B5
MGSVVVNDFEVLREAQPASAGSGAAAPSDAKGGAPEPLPPQDVKDALLALQAQALRIWAH